MKYYIIAGEASGDLHASSLMRALSTKDKEAGFRCWGGDLMEAAGGTLVKHYRELAFMGFWEVLKNLRTILSNLKFCKEDIKHYQPDVLILVDYPGFNLRIADWANAQGLRVFYYISPQVWAWNSKRVNAIKRIVDEMFVILPFEKSFYATFNFPVHFVGHPLLDVIQNYQQQAGFEKKYLSENLKPLIALLPGSRQQEISRMLPVMLNIAERFPAYQFAVAGAPSIPRSFYEQLMRDASVIFIPNHTYDLLYSSKAALVTSGTATLETALFNVPQVVCYEGNRWSYFLARRLVKVKYISLVNLIMDKPVIAELIQENFNEYNLEKALKQVLDNTHRETILNDYVQLRSNLGDSGASERTAGLMYSVLSKSVQ